MNTASEGFPPTSLPAAPAGPAGLRLLSTPALPMAPAPLLSTPALPAALPLLQFQPEQAPPPLAFPAQRAPWLPPRGRPQPREAWGPCGSRQPPAPQKAGHPSAPPGTWSPWNTDTPRPAAAQKQGAGAGETGVPTHLNLDQYVGQERGRPQPDSAAFVEPEAAADVALQSPPQRPFGFPLLHLQPQRAFTFVSVSRAPVAVPSLPVAAAAGEREQPGFSFLSSRPAPEDAVIARRGGGDPDPAHCTLSTGCSRSFLRMTLLLASHTVQFRIMWRILKVLVSYMNTRICRTLQVKVVK